jgi:DNA-directed RNA polymerase subunit RPC12/RpoP
MWPAARPMITAEWLCVRCGATNRKLTPPALTRIDDRCMSCRARHVVEREETPVRWRATER